jgi:hypothetical protein
MWHKDLTSKLCSRHLLGAHGELHKFRPSFIKKFKINGRISPVVQIEPTRMKEYHDELALEMVNRGIKHQSPYEMPDISYLPIGLREAKVNLAISINDLTTRCEQCRNNIRKDNTC